MSFDTKDWQDAPSTATPIDAASLEDLETRLSGYTDDETARAETAEALAAAPVLTGTATLAGGTIAVANANVTANSIVRVSNKTDGGTPGALYISARSAGTSFTIKSTSGTDTSVVYWEVLAW